MIYPQNSFELTYYYTQCLCLDFRVKVTMGGFLAQNTGAFVKVSHQLADDPDSHVVSFYPHSGRGPGRCDPARRPCQTAAAACIGRGTYTTTTVCPDCNRSMIGPGAVPIAITRGVC